VRVGPIKPVLKASGTKRLDLRYDDLRTSFAFNFNLRRYTKLEQRVSMLTAGLQKRSVDLSSKLGDLCGQLATSEVRRCRLTLTTPH